MKLKTYKSDMKFKRFLLSLGLSESLKENLLNKILDKISVKGKLNENEKEFLDNYPVIDNEEIQSFFLLNNHTVIEKINYLLNLNKKIICNLIDRNGRIGLAIKKTINDVESDVAFLELRGGEKVNLKDNQLYNLIFILDKNEYSLESESEYYEKIITNK